MYMTNGAYMYMYMYAAILFETLTYSTVPNIMVIPDVILKYVQILYNCAKDKLKIVFHAN